MPEAPTTTSTPAPRSRWRAGGDVDLATEERVGVLLLVGQQPAVGARVCRADSADLPAEHVPVAHDRAVLGVGSGADAMVKMVIGVVQARRP